MMRRIRIGPRALVEYIYRDLMLMTIDCHNDIRCELFARQLRHTDSLTAEGTEE